MVQRAERAGVGFSAVSHRFWALLCGLGRLGLVVLGSAHDSLDYDEHRLDHRELDVRLGSRQQSSSVDVYVGHRSLLGRWVQHVSTICVRHRIIPAPRTARRHADLSFLLGRSFPGDGGYGGQTTSFRRGRGSMTPSSAGGAVEPRMAGREPGASGGQRPCSSSTFRHR